MQRIGIMYVAAFFLAIGIATSVAARQDPQERPKPKKEEPAKPEKQQEARPPRQEPQSKPQQQERQQPQAKTQPKQDQQEKQQQQHAQPDKQEQHAQQQEKAQQDQQQKQRAQQQSQSDKQQHAQQQEKEQQRTQEQHGRQQQQVNAQQQQRSEQQPPAQPVGMQSQQERHRQEGEQQSAWEEHRAHNWQSEHRSWQQRGGYNGYRIPEDRYNGYFGSGHSFRIYSYPVIMVGGYPRFQYGGFWFSLIDPWPEYWSNNWYDNDDVYVAYSDDGYYLYNRRYPRDRIAVSVYAD